MSAFHIKHILLLIAILLLPVFCFTDDGIDMRLEKNTDRIEIENYFLLRHSFESTGGIYPIVFVYCNNGYYGLYDTDIEYKKIGTKRYFLNQTINVSAEKIAMDIANENMTLEDFIEKYLEKNDDGSYRVADLCYDNLFTYMPDEMLKSILFAAYYNYDFLILVVYGYSHQITLYSLENYKDVIEKYTIPMADKINKEAK